MLHWSDPASSRVYEHPSAAPPTPRPRGQNDLSTRVTRLEDHANWQAENIKRSEANSLARAQDLARAAHALHSRLEPIERIIRIVTLVLKASWALARMLPGFLKCAAAVVVAIMVLRGSLTYEGALQMLKAIGFPGG